ncbi:anti-anti-sigma factor, partial [Burkholderia contaminans]
RFAPSRLALRAAWQRAAKARAPTLAILNPPPKLASLARAYGVDTLIEGTGRH